MSGAMPVAMHSWAWWPVVAVVAVATVTDLRSRRIPNWLVLPFLAAGMVVQTWLHGWAGAGQSLSGVALALLLFGFIYWVGGMGAVDVKLCAAIGAWIGPDQLFIALVVTAMAGGLMALAWALMGGFLGELLDAAANLGKVSPLPSGRRRLRKMPYAPAIAIGTIVSFFAR